jgi:ABC-type glycerol-3-phosphate transport system substrate-binding protein
MIASFNRRIEKMKRYAHWMLMALVLVLGLALAACGGGAAPAAEEAATGEEAPAAEATSEEAPAEEAATGEKAKVTIFVGFGTGTDPDQVAAQEALAQRFNETHDDIEVEFLIVPNE